MPPKIGLQTMIWGPEFLDLDDALALTLEIGYAGVEFAQHPSKLGDPEELERLLGEHGLTLLGLAKGTLQERVRFCGRMKKMRPVYLYVEEWEEEDARGAIEAGFTLALHPHQFTAIDRLSCALPLLEAHEGDGLKFIPDMGHLWLAGDELLTVLQRTAGRLACVHMKDWRPDYGRSFGMYARGFTELGCGILPLKPVWEWLEKNYSGWVVVEQDFPDRDIVDSIRISWDWLHGNECKDNWFEVRRIPDVGAELSPAKPALLRRPPEVVQALDMISRNSARGIDHLYAAVVRSLCELAGAELCSLWEISPRIGKMTLRAFWPNPAPGGAPATAALDLRHPIFGRAVRARDVRVIDGVQDKARKGLLENAEVMTALGVDFMVSVPVLNTYNMHQPELLINLFVKERPDKETIAEIEALATHVAVCAEHAWQGIRAQVMDEINQAAATCDTSQDLLDNVVERVLIHTRSEAASVFLVDPARRRLEFAATTGLEGDADSKAITYTEKEGLPGRVWRENEAYVSRTARQDEEKDGKPLERVRSNPDSVMLMPIRSAVGEVVGIIRCRGRLGGPGSASHLYSMTDETVLDAIQGALSPHLARMLAGERRTRAMTRLTHELRVPIHVTRGAVEFMQFEAKQRGWQFSQNYLGDIEGYMDLMSGLVAKASMLRVGEEMELNRGSRVFALKDVVGPAVRQVTELAKKRGFSIKRVDYGGVKRLPPMYLDQARFQQVVFNLLSNAIKYAQDDPKKFRVEITSFAVPRGYALIFRDWGTGIEDDMRESIFEESIRGPNAHLLEVAGDGLGCWIVREVVRAHGGTVEVTNLRSPTEFTIFLPRELEYPPMANQES